MHDNGDDWYCHLPGVMQCGFSCKVTRVTQNPCLKSSNWVIYPNKIQYTWCECSTFRCLLLCVWKRVVPNLVNCKNLQVFSLRRRPVLVNTFSSFSPRGFVKPKPVRCSCLTFAWSPHMAFQFYSHRSDELIMICMTFSTICQVYGRTEDVLKDRVTFLSLHH